jgi:hypothetical protein
MMKMFSLFILILAGLLRRASEVRKKMFKLRTAANKARETTEAALKQGRKPPTFHKAVRRMMQLMTPLDEEGRFVK